MTTTLLKALHSTLVWIVLLPVALYRRVLSPLKRTPTCRYLPTCSEYAVQAVRTRGIVVGGALAAARIARCNPLFAGGYDPVPAARRHVCQEHS
jgi:putative membrane protein insertion efficiency factor